MSIKSFIGLSDASIKSVSNVPVERIKTILGSGLNQKKALELTFASIPEVDVFEGVLTALEHWNKFFDLPTNGTPFTSVEVVGNTVKLYGGANITLKNNLFLNDTNLVNVEDKARCIVGAGNECFYHCTSLTSPDFSSLTTAGNNCFDGCTSLTSPDFSSLTTAGNACFLGCTSLTTIILPSCTALGTTVGSNDVFNAIAGHTEILLTVPAALMTCNSGNPDGDIQDLIANNTMVTITQV